MYQESEINEIPISDPVSDSSKTRRSVVSVLSKNIGALSFRSFMFTVSTPENIDHYKH